MKQLPLPLQPARQTRFSNYLAGHNAAAVACLQCLLQASAELQVLLWSEQSLGKTHLLQSLCYEAAGYGWRTAYLPMQLLVAGAEEVLEGMEMMDLVCLDDVDVLFGDQGWEHALFHLINRCRSHNTIIVLASRSHPSAANINLPDLRSRLLWGPVFRLKPLDDEQLLQSLIQSGRMRGLEMDSAVARYLLEHCARDLVTLLQTLERLDRESLAQQRRLTVPFVRQVLAV